jgi:hypothetical protein
MSANRNSVENNMRHDQTTKVLWVRDCVSAFNAELIFDELNLPEDATDAC